MKPDHWAYKGGGVFSAAQFLANIKQARARSYTLIDDNAFERFLGIKEPSKSKVLSSLLVGKTYFTKYSYLKLRDATDWESAPPPIKVFGLKLIKRARAKSIPLIIQSAKDNTLKINHARFVGTLTVPEIRHMGAIVQAVADAEHLTVDIDGLQIVVNLPK